MPTQAKDISLTNFKFLMHRSLMSNIIFLLNYSCAIANQQLALLWVETSTVFHDIYQQTMLDKKTC